VKKGQEILKPRPLREGPMQSRLQKVETRLTTMADATTSRRETYHLILLREDGKLIGPTLHASDNKGQLKQMVPIARGLRYWSSKKGKWQKVSEKYLRNARRVVGFKTASGRQEGVLVKVKGGIKREILLQIVDDAMES
jgi:hypothetical protein